MSDQEVTVISRKYDLSIRRQWKCRFIGHEGPLLTFIGTFDSEYDHADLGLIRSGTISYEFYWLDRWYNIFRFHEPDGSLRNFYCNVNMPPAFDGTVLDYVDLDIDIVVWPNFRMQILDRDEFAENAALYGYSEAVMTRANAAVSELQEMIAERAFPFSADEFETAV